MKSPFKLILTLLFTSITAINAAEPSEEVFTQRRDAELANIQTDVPLGKP